MTPDEFRLFAEALPEPLLLVTDAGVIRSANRAASELLGPAGSAALVGTRLSDGAADPPERLQEFLRLSARSRALTLGSLRWKGSAGPPLELRCEGALLRPRDEGREGLLLLRCRPKEQTVGRFISLNEKIDQLTRAVAERDRALALVAGQKRVFELLTQGAPLPVILDRLIHTIEEQSGTGMHCSILLLDPEGESLWPVSAPSLPPGYTEAVSPTPVGPSVGACGAAAHFREMVVAADIATDPRWAGHRDAALRHGLRSAWSVPIITSEGRVLGTFAVYYREARGPAPEDLHLVDLVTRTATIVVEHRRAEEEIRELNERLEHRVAERTARLQELNDQLAAFAYSVSHDLRAPLRAIRGYTEAMLEDCAPLPAEAREYGGRIVGATQVMNRLIEDLLEVSRLGRAELELGTVDLEEVVGEALEQLGDEARGRGTVLVKVPPGVAVRAHGPTLTQIVVNLVSNGLKFVSSGVDPCVEVGVVAQGDRVRLKVADNGIGVPARFHERIFRGFERLHRRDEYPGTGVGLAIVRSGAERMGGRAWVESDGVHGSCFWVELQGAGVRSAAEPATV